MNPLFNRHLRVVPRSGWAPNSVMVETTARVEHTIDASPAALPHAARQTREWQPTAFALGCGMSVILLLSWSLEPTRSLWLALDDSVFWAFNNSLADNWAWSIFWAAANNRAVDVISALGIIGLFVHFALHHRQTSPGRVGAIFLMLTSFAITGAQIGKAMPINRLSPTMLHDDALRLSELVAWLPTKDISGDSFPGDHATVLFIFASVVTFYMPRAYAAVAWAMAIVFIAPRLVGGAHWLTDDLVGSAAIAAFLISCVLATPLHRVVTDGFDQLIDLIVPKSRSVV